jgi:hypothetical protein
MLTLELRCPCFKFSLCLDCAEVSVGLCATFYVYETTSFVFGIRIGSR